MTKDCVRIGILILSDNHITRSGLRRILESQEGFHVLGEGGLASPAVVEPLLRRRPDVILLDLDPNSVDPLGCIRVLEKLRHSAFVILLCDLGHWEMARKALVLGAAGIILKTQPPSVLIAGIHSLGRRDPEVRIQGRETVPTGDLQYGKNSLYAPDGIDSLTGREREIVRLIASGLKNKEVANRLHISDITVRHHLTSIFTKLNVADRQNLLILAHEHGIAPLALSPKAG